LPKGCICFAAALLVLQINQQKVGNSINPILKGLWNIITCVIKEVFLCFKLFLGASFDSEQDAFVEWLKNKLMSVASVSKA